MLLKNDSRLVSGSSDAELRVWALNFTDEAEKKETETEDKDKIGKDGTEEPPSKMFCLDTEGESKLQIKKEEEEDIKDDAVSKYRRVRVLLFFTKFPRVPIFPTNEK